MEDFRERMMHLLLTLPTARLTGGAKGVNLRCLYCEDSKNPTSAHMHIRLPDDNNMMIHNCFKCHTSGIVTHEKLVEWGLLEDPDVLVELNRYNKRVMKLDKNKKFHNTEVFRLDNKVISEGDISETKLKYINERLGTNLSYSDLLDAKIVLNLGDLIMSNRIEKYTRHESILKELDKYFIGFISQDNSFMNMRNIEFKTGKVNKSIDYRYVKYNIFEKVENTKAYYIIPTAVDVTNPKRIKVNIAEGTFDILSVYYNLRNKEQHSIYGSILGSGYVSMVKYILVTLKLINIELHIYADNDIHPKVVPTLRNMLTPFNIPLFIHYNRYEGEKDFGVPLSKIREEVTRIL